VGDAEALFSIGDLRHDYVAQVGYFSALDEVVVDAGGHGCVLFQRALDYFNLKVTVISGLRDNIAHFLQLCLHFFLQFKLNLVYF